MSNTDVVRAAFAAYIAQDRQAAERLIADDFMFTSPQDDHIDREAFFERCFQRLLASVPRNSSKS